jgi:hypothetical protein
VLFRGAAAGSITAARVRNPWDARPLGNLDGFATWKVGHRKDLAISPDLKREHAFLLALRDVKTDRIDNFVSVAESGMLGFRSRN